MSTDQNQNNNNPRNSNVDSNNTNRDQSSSDGSSAAQSHATGLSEEHRHFVKLRADMLCFLAAVCVSTWSVDVARAIYVSVLALPNPNFFRNHWHAVRTLVQLLSTDMQALASKGLRGDAILNFRQLPLREYCDGNLPEGELDLWRLLLQAARDAIENFFNDPVADLGTSGHIGRGKVLENMFVLYVTDFYESDGLTVQTSDGTPYIIEAPGTLIVPVSINHHSIEQRARESPIQLSAEALLQVVDPSGAPVQEIPSALPAVNPVNPNPANPAPAPAPAPTTGHHSPMRITGGVSANTGGADELPPKDHGSTNTDDVPPEESRCTCCVIL